MSTKGVTGLIHLRTQHIGPEELLVAAKVGFDPGYSTVDLADAINRVEANTRAAVPIARPMYVEPDILGAAMSTSLYQQRTGTGPAVVLVHGIADDSSIWAGTVAALSADCACTAIDLPGHGRSPTPTESSAYERKALLASIDEVLDGTGPAVYVGHSLGGYLGLAHSITRPGVLRGLVLVATGPGFRDAAAMADWNDRVTSAPPVSTYPTSPPRPASTPTRW